MTAERRAAHWAATGDTGTSSKAIMRVMLGETLTDGYCYPHDAWDLGRCIGLLDAVPEWRASMSRMAAVGPEWAALAQRWEELERSYRTGDLAATSKPSSRSSIRSRRSAPA
jgi:hypothetical protein